MPTAELMPTPQVLCHHRRARSQPCPTRNKAEPSTFAKTWVFPASMKQADLPREQDFAFH